jgi:hypothetical protein
MRSLLLGRIPDQVRAGRRAGVGGNLHFAMPSVRSPVSRPSDCSMVAVKAAYEPAAIAFAASSVLRVAVHQPK